jgi:hypothetical protein
VGNGSLEEKHKKEHSQNLKVKFATIKVQNEKVCDQFSIELA